MNISEKLDFVTNFSINRDDIVEDNKKYIKKRYSNGGSSNVDREK